MEDARTRPDRTIRGADEPLSAADRALIPAGTSAAYPVTRLQLGMIHESLAGDGDAYLASVRRTVRLPLDRRRRESLERVAAHRRDRARVPGPAHRGAQGHVGTGGRIGRLRPGQDPGTGDRHRATGPAHHRCRTAAEGAVGDRRWP
jgi:hypothetical protein